jgi:hypothetical protein
MGCKQLEFDILVFDEELVEGDNLVVDHMSQCSEAVRALPELSVQEIEDLAVPGEA